MVPSSKLTVNLASLLCRHKPLINSPWPLSPFVDVFKVKKIVVYGLPEEVERAKKGLEESLATYSAEKGENRLVIQRKERLSLTQDEYFFLICNHDEDLASFPSVRIAGYANSKSNPELVIEGPNDSVGDAHTEIQQWLQHFKNPEMEFGSLNYLFNLFIFFFFLIPHFLTILPPLKTARVSEVYNGPSFMKDLFPRFQSATVRILRESGCQVSLGFYFA